MFPHAGAMSFDFPSRCTEERVSFGKFFEQSNLSGKHQTGEKLRSKSLSMFPGPACRVSSLTLLCTHH